MYSLSRREVLKRASAALGALSLPAIVPGSVFGRNAPSNRVSLAAVGVGGRGSSDCQQCFLPLDDVRFVAAVDCRKSRREAFAKVANNHYQAKNVCMAYRDFRDVLARKDVDGLVISTPDHWHVPLAVYAAQAGKDMYVEKPLGVAMAWAWKLREAVARHKVVFQYGTQQRGDQRQFRRACELVRNGYLARSSASTSGPRICHSNSVRPRSRPMAPPSRSTCPPIWTMKCGSGRRP